MTTPKLPSDFTIRPWNSISRNRECEIVAGNIMVILERTGNTWRQLTWEEYMAEREKDGNFTMKEKTSFEQIVQHCTSQELAEAFSPSWRNKEE